MQWVVTYMLLIEATFVTRIKQVIASDNKSVAIHLLIKKQSRASDQARFLQFNSFDPGHKEWQPANYVASDFRMQNSFCRSMQWNHFSIAGNPDSKQRPVNEDILLLLLSLLWALQPFQGNLSPLWNRLVVENCVLQVLMYGCEN